MCNYQYTRNKKRNCNYPELYTAHQAEFGLADTLPVDNEGLCIFHSKQKAWKQEHAFMEYFRGLYRVLKLINSKQEEGKRGLFDFSGIQFMNGPKPLTFADATERSRWDFSESYFEGGLRMKNMLLEDLTLEQTQFDGICSLKEVDIKHSFIASKAQFSHLSITDSVFNGQVYFFRSEFGTDATHKSLTITGKETGFRSDAFFSDSNFKGFVSLQSFRSDERFAFQKCKFDNSFLNSNLRIEGSFELESCVSTLAFDETGFFGTIDFSNTHLAEDAIFSIKGSQPMDDIVQAELAINISDRFKGRILTENFNLNKLPEKDRKKLVEGSKLGKAEIGKGCRKYVCQTEVFTIQTQDSNQDLLLDMVQVFSAYFKTTYGSNLGIEIVHRTQQEVKYFYFTDEDILEEEFLARLQRTEHSFVDTLVNLNDRAKLALADKNLPLIDCLLDMSTWWKKTGMRIASNQITSHDFDKVVNSISLGGSSLQGEDVFEAIRGMFNLAISGPNYVTNIITNNTIQTTGDNNIIIVDSDDNDIDIQK